MWPLIHLIVQSKPLYRMVLLLNSNEDRHTGHWTEKRKTKWTTIDLIIIKCNSFIGFSLFIFLIRLIVSFSSKQTMNTIILCIIFFCCIFICPMKMFFVFIPKQKEKEQKEKPKSINWQNTATIQNSNYKLGFFSCFVLLCLFCFNMTLNTYATFSFASF